MQFIVSFHVEEASQDAAQQWLTAAKAILQQNASFLVSPSTGNGKWCEGHVELMQGQAPAPAGPQLVERK